MFDAKTLLDAVVNAVARPGTTGAGVADTLGQVLGQATQGLKEGAQRLDAGTGEMGRQVNAAAREAGGSDLVAKARDYVAQNPGVTNAALASAAGLLLSSRRGRALVGNAAAVGGLALIGGLAYRAYQNSRSGKPLLDIGAAPAPGLEAFPDATSPAGATSATDAAPAPAGSASPQLPSAAGRLQPGGEEVARGGFAPSQVSDDDALLYVRAMVAAASADGRVDGTERSRIVTGLQQAGIDPEATRWLERELEVPADVEELAAGVTNPDKAAQIYTAARVAIDPDTLQERDFLRRLREALDLDAELASHIDAAAASIKAEAGPA